MKFELNLELLRKRYAEKTGVDCELGVVEMIGSFITIMNPAIRTHYHRNDNDNDNDNDDDDGYLYVYDDQRNVSEMRVNIAEGIITINPSNNEQSNVALDIARSLIENENE